MSAIDHGPRRSWDRSTVYHRFTLGPAPLPVELGETREAILLELVRIARLGRKAPLVAELCPLVSRGRSTVRYHLRALRAAGLVAWDPALARSLKATESAVSRYVAREGRDGA